MGDSIGAFDGTTLITSSATWRPGFRPPLRPMIELFRLGSEPTELPTPTSAGMRAPRSVPPRRCSGPGLPAGARVPETTDGRPANVGCYRVSGILPYFDLGDEDEGGVISSNFWLVDDQETAIPASSSKRHAFMKPGGATVPSRCSFLRAW